MRNALATCCLLVGFTACNEADKGGQLPQVSISLPTDAPALTRDEWIDVRIRITDETGNREFSSPYLSVQGRGHSTFDKPKKPYNLKLDRERSILGLPARKKFALLAGFFDHALIRTALAQEVARQTSLAATTPQGRFVSLRVEGGEQGIYYLCEKVADMVNEETLMFELDSYAINEGGTSFHTAELQLPITVKQPKKLPTSLLSEMERIVNEAEADPAQHVDFDTFADYFLVQELCMNAEPNGPRSCFMHLLPDGRIAAGPVWDFDLAFISVNVDEKDDLRPLRLSHLDGLRTLTPDSLYNANALWYGRLLQDSSFVSHLKDRWQTLKPRFEGLTACIDSLDQLIRPQAITDQQMWNHLEPARFDSCTTYESAIATLRSIYTERIQKLDGLVKGL
ncbi:MAG: CotH kinase family protein [Bacteroidaceae bacterium]|nr:CotH kinase family protein [Bacteroidaceae bacterium]